MRVRSFSLALAISTALLSGPITADSSKQFESIDDLRSQVKTFLYDIYTDKLLRRGETDPEELTIAVSRIDPRLRLQRCNDKLSFDLRDNGESGGNVSVRTRCEGTPSWSIFIQAQVNYSLTVLVARHNLQRGSIVTADDLEQRPVARRDAGSDYVTESDMVVGKELKRPLSQGRALRLAMLMEPKVIKRGDAVMVEAKAGNIYVATPGIALGDGKVGQQIRVKNQRSLQEIKVEVIGPGRVRVVM